MGRDETCVELSQIGQVTWTQACSAGRRDREFKVLADITGIHHKLQLATIGRGFFFLKPIFRTNEQFSQRLGQLVDSRFVQPKAETGDKILLQVRNQQSLRTDDSGGGWHHHFLNAETDGDITGM